MTDRTQAGSAGQAVLPKPSCMRPRYAGGPQRGAGAQVATDVQRVADQRVPAQAAGGLPAPQSAAAVAASAISAAAAGANPISNPAVTEPAQRPGSRRSAAREALDAALRGVRLCGRDRQFLGRLLNWDKRNAGSVASLLWRARLTGRDEAALTPRQLDIVLGALSDAAVYRTSGADALGCWDCENIPGGRCADHVRDTDRARAYADLAVLLSAGSTQAGLPQPTDIAGYRRRTPVAS